MKARKRETSEARTRNQMVIALGDGLKGADFKCRLEQEAKRQGLTLSAWSRRVLLDVVGVRGEQFVRGSEFEALEQRVEAMEQRLRVVEVDLARLLSKGRT